MKQKDLAREFGITPMQIGRLRVKHVPDGDYDKDTKELTENGADILRTILRGNDPTEPQFVELEVCRMVGNPRWVHCKAVGASKPRIVHCIIPSNLHQYLKVGRRFKAHKVTFRGQEAFRHEILEIEERKHRDERR